MGQDIHMAIERWEKGQWTLQSEYQVWDSRNYNMFAILDGRRPGEIPFISRSRGIPQDIDQHTEVESSYGNTHGTLEFLSADHSFSWLLLSEIKSFHWAGNWLEKGLIPLRQSDNPYKDTVLEPYILWKNFPSHKPKGYLSGFSKSNQPTQYQADKYLDDWNIESIKKDGWDLSLPFMTWVSWSIHVKEVAKEFLQWIDDVVSKIDEGNAVRIVFGFDS